MIRVLTAAIAIVALALVSTAQARQDDPRLDALFARLLETTESIEARRIEAAIWGIWIEAGDAALDALMSRGVETMRARQFDEALESFHRIVEADPEFAEGWNKRATVYYLMDEYEASIRDVVRTLELEPRHFGALSGMGLIYTELGDEAAALAWFERALAVNPHMPFIKLRVEHLEKKLGVTRI